MRNKKLSIYYILIISAVIKISRSLKCYTTNLIILSYGQRRTGNFEQHGHRLHTVLFQSGAMGVLPLWALYNQLLAPKDIYLLLGRWSTDRPLPCTTWVDVGMSSRGRALARFFIMQLLPVDNNRALEGSRHAPVHWVSGPEPLSLRSHRRYGVPR